MFDARQVANFLLDYADDRGVKLSNMALLKHIYFAHGWHLASCNKPLVSNRIEAWQHGPVIRAVYDAFKHFEAGPILSRAMMIDLGTGGAVEAKGNFPVETEELLRSTLAYYSSYGAIELSEMTHAEGSPWDQVWNAGDGRVRLNMQIPNEAIRSYFVQQSKSVRIQ